MKNNERDERKTRKVLVPLATLAVAAAVAVGSGADWNSQSVNHVSVKAGTIVHVNNHENGTLSITRLKPGGTATGTVRILEDNANDLDADLTLVASNLNDTITAGDLQIEIAGAHGSSGVIDFEDLDTVDLGRLNKGYGSEDITITVTMPSTAGTQNQGKTASVDLKFVTTTTADPESGTTVAWN